MLYAHSLGEEKSDWQTLEEHLHAVSILARTFADDFNAGQWASISALLHDIGKGSKEFQKRLEGSSLKVDHSSAGAQYLMQSWGINLDGTRDIAGEAFAKILAYVIAGHHSGLPDCGATSCDTGTLTARLAVKIPEYQRALDLISVPSYMTLGAPPISPDTDCAFRLSFFIRMLYSCLTDADFLDTEKFFSPKIHALRQVSPDISTLYNKLQSMLKEKSFLSITQITTQQLYSCKNTACGSPARKNAINLARKAILQHCLSAADNPSGVFSLTVPTGGGKTISSMAFALKHAQKHSLKRVILVVPYTSIIEQNAAILRDILGEDAVLEHHCNYIHPDLDNAEDAENEAVQQYRLSTENWNVSIIVTTAVQFFESLFACRSSFCRKLHNIARSVVILDEAQMLPLPLLEASVAALKALVADYGVSIVLCTATQPALTASPHLPFGFAENSVQEIIPYDTLPILFSIFERVKVQNHDVLSDAQLVEKLQKEKQVLCILNTRQKTKDVFLQIDDGISCFHLSTLMTPMHRMQTLKNIRQALKTGQPCRVISTSLVECGVDISFPAVYREVSGLDSLVQSAGRCNRNGEFEMGNVHVFCTEQGLPKKAADLQRRVTMFNRIKDEIDLFSPQIVQRYFADLYKYTDTDEEGIMKELRILSQSRRIDFKFRLMREQYKIIEEETIPIIIAIPNMQDMLKYLDGFEPIPQKILRQLQQHTVSVKIYEWEKLKQDGRIKCLRDRFYVLYNGLGYNDKTGLELKLDKGFEPQKLLF